MVFLWCCTASACNADGVEFGMGLEDFADRLDPTQLQLLSGGDEVDIERLLGIALEVRWAELCRLRQVTPPFGIQVNRR